MDYKTENARQFLHQLLRYRYNALIRTIIEKFQVDEEKAIRLQTLITCEFVEDALRKEDA